MSDDWDYWEARDAWKSDYYNVKDPPIAYGYMFEGCLAYDGDDFCMGFSLEEHNGLLKRKLKRKQVRRWIAEAYGNGENWGLLPGESSILPVSVPLETLDGIDTLAEGGLTLTLKDAATDELLGSVPVELATSVSLTEAR